MDPFHGSRASRIGPVRGRCSRILKKMEARYKGKAAIVFVDVWKDKGPARRFGIRAIPTQIFFDKSGKEVYRHVGFMNEEGIVNQLKKMGVE
ncbi:MAG: thioredoxin family protein [Deltaproteobacteria bacterium]|nr:thioredoxin family protein [Deltaproteobacteria bacterium]